MSYRKLVEAKVKQAFELIKDLAQNVVFTTKVSSEFDFESGLTTSTVVNRTIKVVVIDNKKKTSERNTIQKTFMAKTAEVGDMKLYEAVTFGGLVWKIGEVTHNDDYVTIVDVYREN